MFCLNLLDQIYLSLLGPVEYSSELFECHRWTGCHLYLLPMQLGYFVRPKAPDIQVQIWANYTTPHHKIRTLKKLFPFQKISREILASSIT